MIAPGQMRVLIVEDNPGDAFLVEEYLRISEIHIDEIHWAPGWKEALTIINSVKIAIILLDLNLVDIQGLETFKKFEKMAPGIPVVVLSGHQEKEIAIETMKMGAQDYLVKGNFSPTLLGKAINYAIERSCYIKNLWEKEEEYKYLFDNNPNPLLTWDVATLKVTMANRAATDFYGLTMQEFLSRNVFDIFEPGELHANKELLHQELVSSSHLFARKNIKAEKETCYVDLVLKDAELNGVKSRIMLVNDVTQQQLAMENVMQSEQQLSKLAGNYPNGLVAIIDRDLIIQFIDGLELHKKGLEPQGMIGKSYTVFLEKTKRENFIKNIAKVFSGEEVVFYEETGAESYLISAAGLSNSTGEIVSAILVSQNITGNVLAKKEILFQANILQNVNEAIVVKDIHGKIKYFNQRAINLLEKPNEPILGRNYDDIIKEKSLEFDFEKVKQQTLIHGKYKQIYKINQKDGSTLVLETTQSFMNDENGNPAFIIGITQDVTDRVEAEQILKESEANLQAIFQSTSQSFILMDTDTRIIAFNKNASDALLRFFQRQIRKGEYFSSLVWENRAPVFMSHLNEVLNRKIVRFEEKFSFPGEKEVHLEITYSPVLKDNDVIGIIVCGENTTERVKAKETILKSEQKYRELVETSIDMIWTINKEGTVVFVNQAAKEIMGWEPSELIGRNFVHFVGKDDKDRVQQHIFEAMQNSKQYSNYESTILRKDGSTVNVITHAVVNHDVNSGNSWLTGTTRDITDRVKAEKELSQKNEQLQLLSSYLQTVREEERAHIAREIHDELGQQLTGLKMDLAWMNRKSAEKNIEFSEKLTDMLKLVDETIKTIRKISSDLRPGILDDLGLIPALEWQCHEFEKRTKVRCKFNNRIPDAVIDKDAATGVFRIFQESLTNITRHSEASEVKVEFNQEDENFSLKINDNGKGFVQDNIVFKKTLGLLGMRERAGMLNGTLSIVSKPDQGTQVKLMFPIKNSELQQS
ncbi:MAG TPA: PAS domain S-box protein [Bacteroidia bacterium]|nr:PAS domain S-box protein [Bacteroidia bacterium]